MQVSSPLSNLRDVLAQVKASAVSYSSKLANNEAATRAAVIDPILRSLGWDIANLDMVEVEKAGPTANFRADYVLFDEHGKPRVVVEAKSLAKPLQQSDVSQLVNYCFAFKIDSAFLTNGFTWRHYTNFNPTNFSPTTIHDIATGDVSEIAAYFVSQLDAAQLWQDDSVAPAPEVLQLQRDYTDLAQRVVALEVSGGKAPPAPTPPTQWFDVDTLSVVTGTAPSQVRLPDGTKAPVKSWAQALVMFCEFVLQNSPNLELPLPDKAGGKRNLLDTAPAPAGKSAIVTTSAGPVYVFTTYSANDSVANINHVLQKLPTGVAITTAAVVYE